MPEAITRQVDLLTRRIRQLEAVDAARFLLARYGSACDRCDLEAVTAMFRDDGCVEAGGRTWVGRESVRSFFREAWAADPSRKTHFIVGVVAGELAGDCLAVSSTFLYTAAGTGSSVLGWGEYRDVVDFSQPMAAFRTKSVDLRSAGDLRQVWAADGLRAERAL